MTLTGITKLAIDTAPVIYFIEEHPQYGPCVEQVFQAISHGSITGVTSVITLTEVLIHPLHEKNVSLAAQYRDLLLFSDHFLCLPMDPAIAECAAMLRASYALRTPDAIQIATALVTGCEALCTNDATMRRV
ncbi:MAG TPA: PIN domain-containing protein [Armatimonadota bacterium]|nr:PIN domain-containing protein [Armatimonadota bacterium]